VRGGAEGERGVAGELGRVHQGAVGSIDLADTRLEGGGRPPDEDGGLRAGDEQDGAGERGRLRADRADRHPGHGHLGRGIYIYAARRNAPGNGSPSVREVEEVGSRGTLIDGLRVTGEIPCETFASRPGWSGEEQRGRPVGGGVGGDRVEVDRVDLRRASHHPAADDVDLVGTQRERFPAGGRCDR